MASERPLSRRRYIARLVVTLSGLAALVLAGYVAIFAALRCSSGDGGVPYVAKDSPQASVCNATGDGVLLTLGLLLVSLALLVLVCRLGRSWARGRRGGLAFFALALTTAMLPAGTALALAPFSSECSARKEAAWSEWYRAGQSGDPPFECAVY